MGWRGWVGRSDEVAAIRAFVSAAAGGRPGVLLCVGEAGMGKSTLLETALAGTDAVVLWATGDESEVDVDFAVIDQMLRSAPVDPSLRSRVSAGLSGDPLEAGAALLRVLDELQLSRTLVVVVDDAQVADAASLQALTFTARRLGADPAAWVVATRPEGVDRLPPGLLRLVERSGGRLQLSGLSESEVAALAELRFGRALPPAAVARLRAHTGGSPLHITALLEELSYDALTGPGPLPAPRSYATLLVSRLAGCPEPARRLLVGLSVLGIRAPLTQAARVAGLEGALAEADELAARGLVELTDTPAGRSLGFPHGLARAAVYEDLPAATRAALHRAAAEVTAGDEALRHRLAGAEGPDQDLAAEAARRAESDVLRGARRAAASHLLGAARVAASSTDRERFVLGAANHLLAAGQPLGAWADEIAGFADCALRSLVLGRRTMITGRFSQARGLLEKAWAQADSEGDEAVRGPVAELLAVLAIGLLETDDVIAWARRALEEAGPGSSRATALAHGLALTGRLAEANREMTAIVDRSPSPAEAADARLGRGIVRMWSNDLDGAHADLTAVAGLSEHTDFQAYMNARAYLAEVAIRQGRLAEAAGLAEAASSVADDADAAWLAPLPASVAAFALALQGDTDRARTFATAATAVADATGLIPALMWSDHAWLRIAAAEGDHETVAAVGDRMLGRSWDALPEGIHHWRALYTEALVSVGRLDDAAAVVDRLARDVADGPDVADASVRTDAHCAAAHLAAAAGDHDAAERAEDAGLALDPVAARPFERARLELAAGARRRRSGRRRDAAGLLEAAAARFAAMGARPWLARCDRELRACGLQPAKRSTPGPASPLTPQETTVARLVAKGRSNREVAAELVVSIKTVEHHLTRIYTKLGVRSRTELAARILQP